MNLKRDYPPHYLLLGLGAMWALRRWWPLEVWTHAALKPVGAAVAGLGLVAILGLAAVFRRHRTTIHPFGAPSALISGGAYRVSRNPIYLAMGLILLGGALWLGNLSALFVPPVFAAIITLRIIRPEERYLAEHFGAAYRDYCRRVPRWL